MCVLECRRETAEATRGQLSESVMYNPQVHTTGSVQSSGQVGIWGGTRGRADNYAWSGPLIAGAAAVHLALIGLYHRAGVASKRPINRANRALLPSQSIFLSCVRSCLNGCPHRSSSYAHFRFAPLVDALDLIVHSTRSPPDLARTASVSPYNRAALVFQFAIDRTASTSFQSIFACLAPLR